MARREGAEGTLTGVVDAVLNEARPHPQVRAAAIAQVRAVAIAQARAATIELGSAKQTKRVSEVLRRPEG